MVEITSDAVALCASDGTILHVNRQLLGILHGRRAGIVGSDIKDLLFSKAFERSNHKPPFSCDGVDNSLMLKLVDGSFVPVRVRALKIAGKRFALAPERRDRERLLVVIKSLEEDYARDRQTRRLLGQLQAANKRLSGTLSIIMSTMGTKDMPHLLDAVLNKLVDTLDADGATIYLAESGGFKLRGVSQGLSHDAVRPPDFIPLGSGVATYVLHAGEARRLSVVSTGSGKRMGTLYDLDTRQSASLHMQDAPPFHTLAAVPIFFGTQVLGILELGWMRPTTPRTSDVSVLEVVCDYLSIELVEVVSAMRARRIGELTRSLDRLRDILFASGSDRAGAQAAMLREVCEILGCEVYPVAYDPDLDCQAVACDPDCRLALSGSIEDIFFSVRTPASITGIPNDHSAFSTSASDEPGSVRLVRVDHSTPAGCLLSSRGLPYQGIFIDLGEDGTGRSTFGGEGAHGPWRRMLFLRRAGQEPIDDVEFDYLERLMRDYEAIDVGARSKESDRRIAQTLQIGMRSSLAQVPGIVADALYSSATKHALVGGDFYTMLRLPDERAVMILGDVSGKGVESASMSAMATTALTAYAWEGMTPTGMVSSLNRMLTAFSRVEAFLTVFVVKIDLRARIAAYCSAGHPPSMVLSHDGEVEMLTTQSGVVGAFESMRYESGSFTFSPGDILFMYTDGVIEARDAAGGFFGEQRLREILLNESAAGVHGLCRKVLHELDTFSGASLDDDVAMVALRLDGIDA
nr:SpoIIE family protein phosphatase [Collinsella urealyticum]